MIIAKIKENYSFKNEIEITLEANPDDIDQNFIQEIVKSDKPFKSWGSIIS